MGEGQTGATSQPTNPQSVRMSHFPSTKRKRDSDSDNLPLLSRHPPSAKIGIWAAAADAAVAPCVRVCMDERDTSGGQTICITVKDYLGPPSVQDIMHVVLGENVHQWKCKKCLLLG